MTTPEQFAHALCIYLLAAMGLWLMFTNWSGFKATVKELWTKYKKKR